MDMNAAENRNFELYSNFYDAIYADKDYAAESAYVSAILHRLDPGIKRLIELGSGTGNHASWLCREGYEITGIEKSKCMVDRSLAKGIKGFYPQVGNIINFELPGEFEAAISLFHVFSFLTGTDEIISCLERVFQHLKPGGIFLFDAWYTPAVYASRPETRVKRVENDLHEIIRIAEPSMDCQKNTVDVKYQIIIQNKSNRQHQVFNETHSLRHFSLPEIALFAQLAGFDLIGSEEFLTGRLPGINTWGVCHILQKHD